MVWHDCISGRYPSTLSQPTTVRSEDIGRPIPHLGPGLEPDLGPDLGPDLDLAWTWPGNPDL